MFHLDQAVDPACAGPNGEPCCSRRRSGKGRAKPGIPKTDAAAEADVWWSFCLSRGPRDSSERAPLRSPSAFWGCEDQTQTGARVASGWTHVSAARQQGRSRQERAGGMGV